MSKGEEDLRQWADQSTEKKSNVKGRTSVGRDRDLEVGCLFLGLRGR